MGIDSENSSRAGRGIANLDRPAHTATNPGKSDVQGRRAPKKTDDAVAAEAKAALDHVQVSGIADIAEDGRDVPAGAPEKR